MKKQTKEASEPKFEDMTREALIEKCKAFVAITLAQKGGIEKADKEVRDMKAKVDHFEYEIRAHKDANREQADNILRLKGKIEGLEGALKMLVPDQYGGWSFEENPFFGRRARR